MGIHTIHLPRREGRSSPGPDLAGETLSWDSLYADTDNENRKPDSTHLAGAEGLLCTRPNGASVHVASDASLNRRYGGGVTRDTGRSMTPTSGSKRFHTYICDEVPQPMFSS